MTENDLSAPVVVGIDGSDAAVCAAVWAVEEAISRDVPLRIVHSIDGGHGLRNVVHPASFQIEYAEAPLRDAAAAVNALGKPVKVETHVLWGEPDATLIAESRTAAMVCVGSVGIGAVARKLFGSTAASVAAKAECPVAVIRYPQVPRHSGANWVAVAVDNTPETERLVHVAVQEARLRGAVVLAVGVWDSDFGATTYDELDRRVDGWRDVHPDVHIYPVGSSGSLAVFLADNREEGVRLAVISGAEASQVGSIIGPRAHDILPHGECSVLIAR